MDVSPTPRTPDHQTVPGLCMPNYGVCQPSMAWLHRCRGCPSSREDPDCSRPRCILQASWHTPKSQLLKALDSPSLRWPWWREIASLCMLHRFLNLQQEPLTNFLPPFAFSRNSRSQRKPRRLILPAARTTKHTTSFFFSTSVAWNTLPAHIPEPNKCSTIRKCTHQTLSFAEIYLK